MGGSARFDYSATGDAINVAARLESANRPLGTRICVGDRTRALCPDMAFRPIGVLTLKGKSYGIQVFEPVPWEDRDPRLSEYLEAYRLMQGRDACAAQALSTLAGRNPDDKLVAFHAARLAGGATGTDVVLEEK
jgi:adenylate cyclase